MLPNTTSRPVTPADFEFIYGLYFHPTINPYLLYEQMPPADFRPIFDDLLAHSALHVFELDGQPAGMFKLVRFGHRTEHIAYVGGVAIAPDYAGKGLGRALLHCVIELAHQQGIRRLELSTATTNERAIHLYESVGFEKEGILRNYTWLKSENRFIDEVLMSLWLENSNATTSTNFP
jgi:RimJ/RimL family protein N-acetyltransferase